MDACFQGPATSTGTTAARLLRTRHTAFDVHSTTTSADEDAAVRYTRCGASKPLTGTCIREATGHLKRLHQSHFP
jgi:hypothetical protein